MKRPTRESRNHLRAWREFRQLTQEQLGAQVDTTGSVISQLEAGERGLSDKWLRKLAPVLGTRPGFLLEFAPEELDGEYLRTALEVPPERRAQALQILRTFKNDAG